LWRGSDRQLPGSLHRLLDASGSTTYTYDNQDRLKTKATPQGTLTYTYDPVGNAASIVSSNINGASASYTRDTLNRLSAVVDNRLSAGQNTTTYTYDPASNLATVIYPNGIQSTFTYDTLNRLTALPISKASRVASYTYGLGPAGQRLSVTEMSGRQVNYTYDGIYRLTNEAISADPSSKNGAVGYALDPVGNRTATTSSLLAIAAATYSYDANDRLASETYDANGNVTVAGGNTYTYDFENRLKSANGGAIAMLYDGDGNRASKTVAGATTKYLVDDLNPTGYAQVVEEIVGGAVQRAYTYGVQRISQNQLIANAWTPSFYGYDGHGSVRLLTDATGTVTDTYDYDAFGNVVNATGSTPNNYLYSGEQLDPNLGLYYLRARYYNSATGRFLTRDMVTGDVLNPGTLHKYLYAEGDPVNRIDPRGTDDVMEYGWLSGWSVPGAIVVATAQTFAAACFGGTVLPLLSMGVLSGVGLEIYDVQTPIPCLVTFSVRPKVRPIPWPRTVPTGPQYLICSPQEKAALDAAKKAAEKASAAFGKCRCPKVVAYTKITLIEAYITARRNVMACYNDGGNDTHWDQVDDLEVSIMNCHILANACPN
jgi:RHS repeat-associated protein